MCVASVGAVVAAAVACVTGRQAEAGRRQAALRLVVGRLRQAVTSQHGSVT